jgi:phage tail-like protein
MIPDAPLNASSFRVEIDGMQRGGALEVVFPEARIGTQRRGKSSPAMQYGPLILRRALTSQEWYEWWDKARRARNPVTRTVNVMLLDAMGEPSTGWTFARSRPVAYQLSNLNAIAQSLLIESLEIAVGGFAIV